MVSSFCFHLQSPPSFLCSHTPPSLRLLSSHQCFSRWFWVQQQQQNMVGALLECTHTHHGQHLFINGPTIPHPPTTTADGGGGLRESSKAKGGIKKNKAVTTGGGKEEDNKVAFANMFYSLFFPFSAPHLNKK